MSSKKKVPSVNREIVARMVKFINASMPAVLRGEWTSIAVEDDGYAFRARWNEGCDAVNVRICISPADD